VLHVLTRPFHTQGPPIQQQEPQQQQQQQQQQEEQDHQLQQLQQQQGEEEPDQQLQQLEQALATVLTQHGITLPPSPSAAPLLAPYAGLLSPDKLQQLAAPVVARYKDRSARGRKAASADAGVLFGPLKKLLVQHLANKAQGKAEVVGLLRLVHTVLLM
jgi:hypothetical protein